MEELKSVKEINQNFLTNPAQGQLYLKAALERGNEQDFLQALHNIMDSLLDSHLDPHQEISPTITTGNLQIV